MNAHTPSGTPEHAAPNRVTHVTTRREFLHRTAALAGAAVVSPGLLPGAETPPFAPPWTR